MDYLVHSLLDESKAKALSDKLLKNRADWEDGKKTAGSLASEVKNNLQLNKHSKVSIECSKYVAEKITQDPLLKSFCIPKSIHGLIFSLTSIGEGYGEHVDNAYMSSGRSDISFTLFLSPSNQYKGGDLCIQSIQDSKEIKLRAGEIIIYPSNTIHSVKKVTQGERLACVGWIHSYIASSEDRNTLFGLDAGAKRLLASHGRSPELDLIFQSYNNLLRRLAR